MEKEVTGWIRCSDDNYPDTNLDIVVIAMYDECDKIWYHWTSNECPYGWNVLCQNIAYWQALSNPKLA